MLVANSNPCRASCNPSYQSHHSSSTTHSNMHSASFIPYLTLQNTTLQPHRPQPSQISPNPQTPQIPRSHPSHPSPSDPVPKTWPRISNPNGSIGPFECASNASDVQPSAPPPCDERLGAVLVLARVFPRGAGADARLCEEAQGTKPVVWYLGGPWTRVAGWN
jgi:hypothetical protein